MARALLGYVGSTPQHIRDVEIARLRSRVRELEAEVAEVRAEAAAHRAVEYRTVEHRAIDGGLSTSARRQHPDSVDAELSRIVTDSAVHA